MIKIFLLSVIALTGMIGFTSCTDYLDKSPNSDIAENDPYKNFKNFQGFIEELYNRIPIVSNNDYHTCINYGEDEYWEPQELRLFARNIDYGDFGDGLPVTILIRRHAVPVVWAEILMGICGKIAGMAFVRQTLVLLISIT